MRWTLAILVAVLAFLAMALLVQPETVPAPEPPSPVSPALEERRVFREGLNLFKDSRFAVARERFLRVQELAQPSDHVQARRYLEACDLELSVAALRENALEALRKGDLERALDRLSEVGAESLQHLEAERDHAALLPLARGLRAMEDEDARGDVLKLLRDLAGKHDSPRAVADAVWQEVEVHLRGSLVIAQGLHEADPNGGCQVATRGMRLRPLFGPRDSLALIALDEFLVRCERVELDGEPLPSTAEQPAFRLAIRHFDREEFEDADDLLRAAQQTAKSGPTANAAGRLATAIANFAEPYKNGMAALRARQDDEAIQELTRAEKLVQGISKEGRLHRFLRVHLSRLHTRQGQAAINAEVYPVALEHYSKALHHDPSQQDARRGMRRLKNLAKELYLEGYTQKALNPAAARAKFGKILVMAPPEFEYHQKAKQQLQSMRPD